MAVPLRRSARVTPRKASGPSPSPPPRARAPPASPRPASPPPRRRAAPATPLAAVVPASSHAGPHFEFGGPVGALLLSLLLPAVCYALVAVCNDAGCLPMALPLALPPLPARPWVTASGCAAYAAWLALCVGLHLALPGATAQGTLLRDGTRLQYKLNGLSVFAALALLFGGATAAGWFDPAWVHANFLPLLSAGTLFAFAFAAYLYAASFVAGKLLAAGGATGHRVYDFFIGRELNPRLGGVDLKQFCELTPGLIGWLFLDLCFAWQQRATSGALSPSMLLVCAFHGLYVLDALACEPAILTTMDITTDGFGFMLVFGDLVWVPFTYCLQARYLLEHPVVLPPWALAGVVALQAVGYHIFRGANSQKDAFRKDPSAPGVAHLASLATQRGTRLLVAGWWGRARHINYLGDWLMALAWCLPCGAASPVPYFYAAYFAALLLHRERRDEEACLAKYGAGDWGRYTAAVPWRIIPYVY